MMTYLNSAQVSQMKRVSLLRHSIAAVAAAAGLGLSACQTATPIALVTPERQPESAAKPMLLRNSDFNLWERKGVIQCAVDWVCGQHTGPLSYLFSYDKVITKSGSGSASLERTGPEDWGTMWQNVDFRSIAGRKIRIAAHIKRAGVVGRGGGLSFVSNGASMTDEAPTVTKFIEGTNDWQREEIAVTLPKSIGFARVGFALEGSGKVWVDNFVIEVLPN